MQNLNRFELGFNNEDLAKANFLLMQSLAELLVKEREDFVHLLNESGIQASSSETDAELIQKYVNGLVNRKLLLGTSMLLAMHNAKMGFDGDDLDDDAVKKTYNTMRVYYIGDNYSNAGGADPVSAVAEALAQGAKLGTAITNKKSKPLELIEQKQQAKQALVSGVLQARQAQLEEERKKQEQVQKTLRTGLMVGGAIILLVVGVVLVKKMSKK